MTAARYCLLLVAILSATGSSGALALDLRINTGGGAYTDNQGNLWQADTGYNTGNVASTTAAIAGTEDDTLYRTERWDPPSGAELRYDLPVAPGSYKLKLHFAEIYSGAFSNGARVFDVWVEGQLALPNQSIYDQVGPNTALVETLEVSVSDNTLSIEFVHGVENPKISAIEIVPSGAGDTQPPTVPSGVTAVDLSTSSARVSWNASSDQGGGSVAGYRVYRDGALAASVGAGSTNHTDNGLNPGQSYQYRVLAFDDASPENASAQSSPAATVTLPSGSGGGQPAIRINTGGGAYTDNQGNLWQADTGYNTGNVASTTAAIAGTEDDTLYRTERWDPPSGAELRYDLPVAPGTYNLKLHFAEIYSGAFSNGARVFNVRVEGQTVTALSGLDVYARAGGPNTALVETLEVSVSDNTLSIEFVHGVENPKISAIEIVPSGAGDTQPPTVPNGVTAVDLSTSSARVSWNASSDQGGGSVAGYRVYRDGALAASVGAGSTNHTDNGLNPGQSYQYRVLAFDDANPENASAQSNPAATVTLPSGSGDDTQPPTVPSGVTAVDLSTSSARVSWNASSDQGGGSVAGYRVYRDGALAASVGAGSTNHTDNGLNPGQSYQYRVLAFDDASPENASAQSSPAATVTLPSGSGGGQPAIRINTGGGAYTDNQGNLWQADTGYNTGNVASTTAAIAGTEDDTLYRTERWDPPSGAELRYDLPVAPGTYNLKLHFAEIYSGAFSNGARVFNVRVEGQTVTALSGLDVYARAGGPNTALVETLEVSVSDNTLSIEFVHGVENPKISAIEIVDSGTVAATAISPNAGAYTGAVAITLTTPTSGAEIYYTVDGSTPNQSATLYSGPFTLNDNAVVKARTFKNGTGSTVTSQNYAVSPFPPTYDFGGGSASEWSPLNPTGQSAQWAVGDGAYRQTVERSFVLYTDGVYDETYHLGPYSGLDTDGTLTDYRVSAKLTPRGQWGNDIGLMFRFQDANNFYRVSFNSGYGFARLEKRVGGTFSTLAVDGRAIPVGQSALVTVALDGPRMQVFVDGEARFAAVDSSFSSGSVALYAQDKADFDDVVIEGNSTTPAIVIAEPLAYSVTPQTQLTVSAVADPLVGGGNVAFFVGSLSCGPVSESAPGFFQATCPNLPAGDYPLEARWTVGGTVYTDLNPMVGVGGDYYVTVGDSITNGVFDYYPLDNRTADQRLISDRGYQAPLADRLNAALATPNMVFNEGIPGDRSDDAPYERIASILERHPLANKALIQVGTNDYGGSLPTPSGLGCSGSACNGTFKENLQLLVSLVTTAGMEAVVANVPPFFSMTTGGNPLALPKNQLIQEYNQVIANELNGSQLGADTFGLYLGNGVNRFNLYWDEIHPHGLGLTTLGHEWSRNLLGQGGLPFQLTNLTVRLSSGGVQDPMLYKQDLLTTGTRYLVDASHSLGGGIPSQLAGGVWLSTFDSHANETRDDYLQFSVDRSVEVYVAFDPRATQVPNWLSSNFTKLNGTTVAVNHPSVSQLDLYLYDGNLGPGTMILGGASASGVQIPGGVQLTNYVVIVKRN